jgi:hypothetical protein
LGEGFLLSAAMQDRGIVAVDACETTSRMSVWQDGARSQATSVGEQIGEIRNDCSTSIRPPHTSNPASAKNKPGALRKECKYRKTEM